MRWLCVLLALIAAPLQAEEVVLGLSQDEVAITTNFDGSEITLYGAIKREKPIPDDNPLQIIVTISGPLEPVTVRRKDQRLGIWVNVDSLSVSAAPSFYAIGTSAPWDEVINEADDLRHTISIPRAIRSVGAWSQVDDPQEFIDALIRIRMNNNSYALKENAVELRDSTLFTTSIQMPANLTEGDYATRIFLTRGGKVISTYETSIDVRKVGLERWLFNLSRQQPLLYGLLSLAIAIAAGWGASAAFRVLRSG
ncbi:TIGR02186 family protein [Marivita sp. S6314]|uniref:TIGR02186 family protein n=1 Tax=Marivita sp. S6314 TaxID=2926406 RepID=UPI001FF3A0D1|nr:TIGR02186 family protein [Marivita sp. S6314]MCK0150015.1 TIGR02186 family protein [Marivita sp. S6314]